MWQLRLVTLQAHKAVVTKYILKLYSIKYLIETIKLLLE